MAVIDGGSSAAGKANVDANFKLEIVTPIVKAQAGFVALGARNDDGTITGTARVNRIIGTEGGALKVAPSILLWDDTFNATAQNTAKYTFTATTQTGAQAGGFIVLNNSAITTINTNSGFQTFRTFPLFAKSELRCNISALLTQVPQTNNLIEFGLFSAVLSTRVAPLDGVFFRYNAAGELRGVINYNGTETVTAAMTAPSANVNHDYLIVVQTNVVVFYIDDVVRAVITLLTDATTLGQPMAMAAQPFTARTYIGGSAPALATQLKISDAFITLLGADVNKPWAEQKAGFGHMAYQGQNGGTMGTTAQYANNTNPAATVPTNTTAALGTGLGGKFQETLTLAAGTDGILCSFQVPAGSVTQTPRNLVITGITISGVVTVALTTNPLSGTLALCFGHTAVSLATAETGSFVSGTTKAARRIAIGATSLVTVTSAPGTPVAPIAPTVFRSPIVVAPGEFVAISHNKVSVAPATGAIMWSITFDAYYE